MEKFFFFPALIILWFDACNEKNEKEIIIYLACGEAEIANDLEYSAESNKQYFENNRIELSFSEETGKCGYELRNGVKTIKIHRALTDIELYEECKKFFGN